MGRLLRQRLPAARRMKFSVLLVTCVCSLGQTTSRTEWRLAPQLTPGLELVYVGTYSEEHLIPRVQFQAQYGLEARVLVLDTGPRRENLALMTSLSQRLPRADTGVKENKTISVRLEPGCVDAQGRVTDLAGGGLLLAADRSADLGDGRLRRIPPDQAQEGRLVGGQRGLAPAALLAGAGAGGRRSGHVRETRGPAAVARLGQAARRPDRLAAPRHCVDQSSARRCRKGRARRRAARSVAARSHPPGHGGVRAQRPTSLFRPALRRPQTGNRQGQKVPGRSRRPSAPAGAAPSPGGGADQEGVAPRGQPGADAVSQGRHPPRQPAGARQERHRRRRGPGAR